MSQDNIIGKFIKNYNCLDNDKMRGSSRKKCIGNMADEINSNPKAKIKIFREKLQVSPNWTRIFIVQHKMTKTETSLNWNIVQHSYQTQNILFASRRSFEYYINLFIYQNSRRRICFPTFYPSIFPCG